MASKIQSHNFYVAITPYKVQGVEDQFNELCVTTGYTQYQHQFYVSLHAGWMSTFGSHGSIIMGDQNPLTAATWVYVKESPKNSQKTINEMGGALELAKADIAWLFDERMWPELQQFVKDVALYGYNAMLEERIRSYKNERTVTAQVNAGRNESTNNSKSATMEKTLKAADLIGKTIVVGDNQATIVIKSVDGDKLSGEFAKDGKTTPMSFPVSQLQDMTEKGLWKISDANEPSAVSPQTSEVTTDVDVAEVDDIVPVVTAKPKAKPAEKPAVTMPMGKHGTLVIAGVGGTKEEPKANSQKPEAKVQDSVPATGKLTYATYEKQKTNKTTGKPYTVTHAKIMGFAATDEAYQRGMELHGAVSGEMVDGVKVLGLYFSHRYAAAAKDVCDALNEGKPFADCVAIIDNATEENAKKREEWKAKIEERKQKRDERKARKSEEGKVKSEESATAQPAMDAKEQAMFELFKKFMAGDKSAMEQVGTTMMAKAA